MKIWLKKSLNLWMPKPSLPYLSHTLLGKTSSFDCLILKEPFLSDLCIEWRSPILVAAIKTYPTGKIYGKLGFQSVLKCYYGELEPMQFPQERTFSEESNMLIHLAFFVMQKLREAVTCSLSVTLLEPCGQTQVGVLGSILTC